MISSLSSAYYALAMLRCSCGETCFIYDCIGKRSLREVSSIKLRATFICIGFCTSEMARKQSKWLSLKALKWERKMSASKALSQLSSARDEGGEFGGHCSSARHDNWMNFQSFHLVCLSLILL